MVVTAARPAVVDPARLWSLDALRGLCAIVVFLSHWHLWSGFSPAGSLETLVRRFGEITHDTLSLMTWPTGGHHPAVIGFFVLSGFCIHYPFERRARAGASAPDWADYFARRFRRIMPVYWAACVLGLVFVAAETLQPTGHPLMQLHAATSLEDIVVRLTGLAGVYPKEIFAGNYILTTVTVEMVMYAVYPLFYRGAMRIGWRALGGMFVALHLFSVLMLPFVTPYWVFNSAFMLGIFWYAGALCAHLYLTRRPHVRVVWLLLAWAVFLALKVTPHFYGLNLLKQAAWGAVCALGILCVLQSEIRRPQWRDYAGTAWLCRAGDISYTLYAAHTPAIMLATWGLLRVGYTNYVVQLGATMAASLLATFAIHYGIERKFYQPPAKADCRPVAQPAPNPVTQVAEV